MTVLLHHSGDIPASDDFEHWSAVTGTRFSLGPEKKLTDIAQRLEEAFDAIRDLWWQLGNEMGADPSARISHTCTAGAFGSDFGVMLAWDHLVRGLSVGAGRHLVVCDDPWLFRHLASLDGVIASQRPRLWSLQLWLVVRGLGARIRVGLRALAAALKLRHQKNVHASGQSALVVYGHPCSDMYGNDAYFGPLMTKNPELKRYLHTDCSSSRAGELASDKRTASLHAWGHPFFAFVLLFSGWQPNRKHRNGPYGWLVRRAAARENGGGGPAMDQWQLHCQSRWLREVRPAQIFWPWENHAWERELCRVAKSLGIGTTGYLHTPFGRHHLGISCASNPDGSQSLPDRIVCTGPALITALQNWGYEKDRMINGGSLRNVVLKPLCSISEGPVLFALPNSLGIAREMLEAAESVSAGGQAVLVKPHPMTPGDQLFIPDDLLTNTPLPEHNGLSAVVFASSSIGLETQVGGMPAVRFRPEGEFAPIAALADELTMPAADADHITACLKTLSRPKTVEGTDFFAPPNFNLWKQLLNENTES